MAVTPEVVDARFQARTWQNRARLLELGARGGEWRDPTAATRPLDLYQTPGTPMIPRWDAGQALRMAYLINVIVWRCMNIVANVAAACPFRAGDTIPDEPGKVVPDNRNARLAQLLGPPPGGPAPKLTARRLMAWTVVQRRVTGRYGWEVETSEARGKGEVAALWPLVSANLQAVPSTSGTDWFTSFLYGPQGAAPNKLRTLNPDQIVYGWDPSAEDFRQPESCLQAARLDVSIAVMSDRYAYGFLRNDAKPAAVVVTEAFESDEAYRGFKSAYYGEFGGPDNAGKTLFAELPDDAAYKPSEAVFVQTLGLSQKQAQFMEQHQASLERVAIACGVPWSRLSAADRTFDNASEENENFWFDTMLPLLADLADEINMQLAPRVGREVGWFDLSHVKVFQPQRRFVSFQDAKFALDEEVVTRNEVRDEFGWDDVEGGDVFRRPTTQWDEGETVPQVVQPDEVVEPLDLPQAASATVESRSVDLFDVELRELLREHGDGPGVSPALLGVLARQVESGELSAVQAIAMLDVAPQQPVPQPVTVHVHEAPVSVQPADIHLDVAAPEVTVQPADIQVDVAAPESPEIHIEIPRSRRVVERDDDGRVVSVVDESC